MKKSLITKILLWSGGSFLVLFLVLVVHIYQATHKENAQKTQVQLSRIDFTVKPDSVEAQKIRSFVKGLNGVESTYFNIKDGIFVYTYEVGTQTSLGVYTKLMEYGHYQANRFIVDPEMAKTGCPVIDDRDSFRSKLVMLISKI